MVIRARAAWHAPGAHVRRCDRGLGINKQPLDST
ncbi:MAG: hypothetical protein JWO59_3002 [Chloroflexi bacterium]|nr:hypothetical protein [Chloroflexota bacterium]